MEFLGSSRLPKSCVTILLLLLCIFAAAATAAAAKPFPGAFEALETLGTAADAEVGAAGAWEHLVQKIGAAWEHGGRPVCEVGNYGALGTGERYETAALQAAIDACGSFAGGGLVYFPGGTYLTGTLFLRSNVTLWIDEGATLLGSPSRCRFPFARSQWYTLLAQDVENVEVTGGGSVAGQGMKFVVRFDETKNVMVSWNSSADACEGDECRPRLLGFLRCRNVRVWNLRLRDSPYWCLHIVNSDRVSIHDMDIYGDFNTPNNDGIDIESSNNTVIKNCRIDTGDDAICPKTNAASPLYNLTVTNCWIRTKSCAVKLGSGTDADFHSLHFENLTIVDSHRGLGLQLRDSVFLSCTDHKHVFQRLKNPLGYKKNWWCRAAWRLTGSIDNVSFVNIEMSTRYYDPSWWGRAEPIYITACARNTSTKVGSISNVRFVNVSAVSENGIFIAGSKESLLRGLSFRNVSLRMKWSTDFRGGMQDYRPGCRGLVEHRTSGVFMAFVRDVVMEDVRLDWQENHNLSNDWGLPLDFFRSSVNEISLRGFSSSYPDRHQFDT